MPTDPHFKPFLTALLNEGEDNPASRMGQEVNFESAFSKLTGKVPVEVDPKLVTAFREMLAQQVLQNDDPEWLAELVADGKRLDAEYKHGKISFTLATAIMTHLLGRSDRTIDAIGAPLCLIQDLVWPTDLELGDKAFDTDPATYETSDEQRADTITDCVNALYDPKEPLNICADADAAYIAACQLIRAGEDAKKEAVWPSSKISPPRR